MKSVTSITILFAALFASSCNYQVKKNLGASDAGSANKVGATIVFADVQTKVLGPNCAKCHDEFETYKSLMASGDVVAGNAAASGLFQRLKNNGGDMPSRAPMISDESAALLRDWINGGALETLEVVTKPTPLEPAPAPQPNPVPADPAPVPLPVPPGAEVPLVNPTFTDLEAKVFSQKCTMCHSDSKRVSGFSLETYDGLINNTRLVVKGDAGSSGIYVSVAAANPPFMPPKRAVAAGQMKVLTDDEKSALKAWIDAGAPRN